MTEIEKYKKILGNGQSVVINSYSVTKSQIKDLLNFGGEGKITIREAKKLSIDVLEEYCNTTQGRVIFDFT